jgi:hypothetical protein
LNMGEKKNQLVHFIPLKISHTNNIPAHHWQRRLGFFFFPTLWCSHTGDHPQEKLAKFGYKSEKKVKKNKESCYDLVTCSYCLSMIISEKKSLKKGPFNIEGMVY